MRVSATQNQKTENKQFSPLKWATVGALSGYILKNELPITEYEREHYQYDDSFAKAKDSIEDVAKSEIESIKKIARSEKRTDAGYDLFLKFNDKNATEATKSKLMKIVDKKPAQVKATFQALTKQVADKVEEARNTVKVTFNSFVNRSRPYSSHIGIGALLVTSGAFVWHVLSRMSSEPEA